VVEKYQHDLFITQKEKQEEAMRGRKSPRNSTTANKSRLGIKPLLFCTHRVALRLGDGRVTGPYGVAFSVSLLLKTFTCGIQQSIGQAFLNSCS
jgi:hypothetical protein